MKSEKEENYRNSPRVYTRGLVVIAILAIATILRFSSIAAESFWIDEIFTLETSAGNGLMHERLPANVWLDPAPRPTDLFIGGGLAGIVRYAHEDTQAPLYFFAMNLWRHAFGSGEAAVRALSALCSIACVWLIYRLMMELWDGIRLAAALAAMLAALAGTQIVFAQEARPYAAALTLSLLAALLVVRGERNGFRWRNGAALGAVLLLMLVTHYTAVAPAAAIVAFGLWRFTPRQRLRLFASATAAALVFGILLGPTLLRQRAAAADRLAFLNESTVDHAWQTLDRALCQPAAVIFSLPTERQQSEISRRLARSFGVVLIFAPLPLLRRRRELLLPWLLMIFPIALTAASDLAAGRAALALPRFSYLSSAGVFPLAALLIARVPSPFCRIGGAASIALLAAALAAPNTFGVRRAYDRDKPDPRPMRSTARGTATAGDTLILLRPPGMSWQAGALFAAVSHDQPWPGPMIVIDEPLTAETARAIAARGGGVWLLRPSSSLESVIPPAALQHVVSVRNMGTLAKLRSPRGTP